MGRQAGRALPFSPNPSPRQRRGRCRVRGAGRQRPREAGRRQAGRALLFSPNPSPRQRRGRCRGRGAGRQRPREAGRRQAGRALPFSPNPSPRQRRGRCRGRGAGRQRPREAGRRAGRAAPAFLTCVTGLEGLPAPLPTGSCLVWHSEFRRREQWQEGREAGQGSKKNVRLARRHPDSAKPRLGVGGCLAVTLQPGHPQRSFFVQIGAFRSKILPKTRGRLAPRRAL